MAGPVKISILADAGQATNELKALGANLNSTEERLDAAGRAAGKWADKADFAGGAAAKLAGASGDIGGSLAATGLISDDAAAKFDQVGYALMGVAGLADVATTASALYAAAQDSTALASARNVVSLVAGKVALVASTVATNAAAAAQWLWNAAMSANPLGLIIIGIVALVAGLVLLWQHSETFREIVTGAFNAVAAAGKWLWDNALKPAFTALAAGFMIVWNAGRSAFEGIRSAVSAAIGAVQAIIRDGVARVQAIWAGILSLVATVIDMRDKAISTISGMVGRFIDLGRDLIDGLLRGLKNAAGNIVNFIKNLFGDVIGIAKKILGIGSPSKVMAGIGRDTVRGLVQGIDAQLPQLASTVAGITDTLTGGVTGSLTLSTLDGGTRTAAGSVVNVTVTVPPASDPAEVGRQIVKAIRSFETTFGRTVLVA